MENASDALFLGFAIMIFIAAISVSFYSLAQAKSTADTVLFYSDRANFQTFLKDDEDGNATDGGRTVGIDTVISTIYRCTKEKFSVKIINGANVYNFEYDADTEKGIKEKIADFVKTNITSNVKYRETYVEIATSGMTYAGADGVTLEEDVGKKIYITFTKI